MVAVILTVIAVAMAVIPALADPITNSGKPVTPKAFDIVGFGSDVTQNVLDQFSIDYNASISASAPHLYSWDATNPGNRFSHDVITAKSGCPMALRPDGSSEGITGSAGGPYGLTANTRTKNKKSFCADFARSSRTRMVGDPPAGPGGIQFLAFALDGVTWATNKGSLAPSNLTIHQLFDIYTCRSTNWSQVGGKSGLINAQLPQAGSATGTFFLTAIGVSAPGPCVDDLKGESLKNAPEDNEGVNNYLQGENTIYPYSIGKYIAQLYHSARCLNSECTPVRGVVCVPKKGLNRFGCDTHGSMVLHTINSSKPTVPWPLPVPSSCPDHHLVHPLKEPDCAVISRGFVGGVTGANTAAPAQRRNRPAFLRYVFEVVRWARGTPDNVPKYLQHLFGRGGWVCASKAAQTDMVNYGFLPLGSKSCQ